MDSENVTPAPIRGFLITLVIGPVLMFAFPIVVFLPDAGIGGLLMSVLLLVALWSGVELPSTRLRM